MAGERKKMVDLQMVNSEEKTFLVKRPSCEQLVKFLQKYGVRLFRAVRLGSVDRYFYSINLTILL